MNEDLADVQKIMTQNIHDVLGRGERIECARAATRDAAPRTATGGRTELAARRRRRAAVEQVDAFTRCVGEICEERTAAQPARATAQDGPGVIVVLFVAGGLWWRFFAKARFGTHTFLPPLEISRPPPRRSRAISNK